VTENCFGVNAETVDYPPPLGTH